MCQIRIHVALPLLLSTLPLLVRSCLSWHYPNSPNSPNSPKNRKTSLSPRHDWR
ncbi:serine/threonine protein kinase [Salmonella enterica subsp. enterica serovar Solt]|nr:serine/threonine protein kinase [Salmonella enterica subsp. enterica serovar Solt]ECB1548895.1 serine/threonine protein kinase [Salmonella enterica subsp. enterica serovar Solt]